MKYGIVFLTIFLILVVSLSGCLSGTDSDSDSANETLNESNFTGSNFTESGLNEPISNESNSDSDIFYNYPYSEVFGTYSGYDFTESEITGMWENVERSSDDMMFHANYSYRYQLDTANLGSGWRQYEWYEGTWRIENGCIFVSLNGSFQYFEDTWIFTKNEDGTMNCVNNSIFKKTEPIVAK